MTPQAGGSAWPAAGGRSEALVALREGEGSDPGGLGAIRSRAWVHFPPLGSFQLCQRSLCCHPNLSADTGTQWVAQGICHWHTVLSASPINSSSCSCHHPFLTSDVDLDFPTVLAPSGGNSALPEPCVRLCQVSHLKLTCDLPRLNDGFDELWAQKVPSGAWPSPPAPHTGLKLPGSPLGRWMRLRQLATRAWW